MLRRTRVEIAPLVHGDIEARVERGRQTYGGPFTSGGSRDALWEAYEEALDLALYLRQEIEDRRAVAEKEQ